MWIVRLALNRTYTFVVLSLLLFLVASVMLLRTPGDIFPEINIPVFSTIWARIGLVPKEMETSITSIYESALTTMVRDVDHIESQSPNGIAVSKVYLQPQANVLISLSGSLQTTSNFWLNPSEAASILDTQKAERVAMERHKAGRVRYLDVVYARQSVLKTEQTAAQISGQRLAASVVLIKALGGGWAGGNIP
jgi:hypothetical protein